MSRTSSPWNVTAFVLLATERYCLSLANVNLIYASYWMFLNKSHILFPLFNTFLNKKIHSVDWARQIITLASWKFTHSCSTVTHNITRGIIHLRSNDFTLWAVISSPVIYRCTYPLLIVWIFWLIFRCHVSRFPYHDCLIYHIWIKVS